jgi:hypothetical protein
VIEAGHFSSNDWPRPSYLQPHILFVMDTAVRGPTKGGVQLPSASRQATFFATGALAGAASLPVETVFLSFAQKHDYTASIKHIRSSFVPILARTGVRFLSFDHVRTYTSHFLQLPITLCGALGGAAGGLNEVILHSLVSKRQLPPLHAALSQSGKLFFCFGSYTYLSTHLSRELPPRPFWKCWLMGATAGSVGSAIIATIEGARGKSLMAATLRGSLVIGTVISVQVTTCAAGLRQLER